MGAGATSEPRQTHTFPAPDSGRWCGAGHRLAVLDHKGHARPAGDTASLSGLRLRLCPERALWATWRFPGPPGLQTSPRLRSLVLQSELPGQREAEVSSRLF